MSHGPTPAVSIRRGLLDTSAVIHLERIADPQSLPDEATISAITLAELSVGPLVALTLEERAVRQARLQRVEARFDPIPFDTAAAQAFGRVSAELRAAGRKPAARGFDMLIASVAIANGLPLYTCNPKDFAGINGLDLVAVPHPDKK
ncbi:MAG: type II toxin-antitoxin system VapC family toxin [Segniliparus sp.]|uniref:type II toxin-antitoxin system VapC family toxin n=1 Tax=Segniliparus sp. TaxID=2804064 RepID=UPI003F313583